MKDRKKPLSGLKIVLDIDGTVFYHRYPFLGKPLPGWEYIREWANDGATINISTMRHGKVLQDALDGLDKLGIKYSGVQRDMDQHLWTTSPKCYGHIIVDDIACGIPVAPDPEDPDREYVLLDKVDAILRSKFIK